MIWSGMYKFRIEDWRALKREIEGAKTQEELTAVVLKRKAWLDKERKVRFLARHTVPAPHEREPLTHACSSRGMNCAASSCASGTCARTHRSLCASAAKTRAPPLPLFLSSLANAGRRRSILARLRALGYDKEIDWMLHRQMEEFCRLREVNQYRALTDRSTCLFRFNGRGGCADGGIYRSLE